MKKTYFLLFLLVAFNLSAQTNADYLSWWMAQKEAKRKGDFHTAIDYLERQIKYQERLIHESEDEFLAYGHLLCDLGDSYYQLGDYAKALESYTMAEPVYKATTGENSNPYANVLNALSLCYENIGDYDRAIELCTQSLKHTEALWGNKSTHYANKLHNLGIQYGNKGDYPKTLEMETLVSELVRRNAGKKSEEYAHSLSTLSFAHYLCGDTSQAIETAIKALDIYKKTDGENSPRYASVLKTIALYFLRSHDYSKALESCTKAMVIYEDLNATSHPDYADVLALISYTHYLLNDHSKSMFYFRKHITLLHSNTIRQFAGLTTNQRHRYWSLYSSQFTDAYPFLVFHSHETAAPDLYDKSALFAKGLLLSTEVEMNRLIQESGDKEALGMFTELQQHRRLLQQIIESPSALRSVKADSLSLVIESLEQRLVRRSKAYGDFAKRLNTTWKEVQQALRPDEIAIEFLSFHDVDDTIVAALTLRKDDTEPKFTPLFELQQLKNVPDTENYLCPEMTDLIWKPLQKELTGIHRVYFSPSGVLHNIGIEYVPGIEEYEFYRVSSTREIVDRKEDEDSDFIHALTASLYGGIDYDAPLQTCSQAERSATPSWAGISMKLHRAFVDSLSFRGASVGFIDLPGTKKEVEAIKHSFDDKGLPSILHTGAEASETSVKNEDGRAPRILHIATHGFFFAQKPDERHEMLRFLVNKDNIATATLEDKALTRSGLILAGGNNALHNTNLPIDTDDGIITAKEIASLDLRGLNLVVLSACETGNGEVSSEGVYGLQRAFKKAGAQTIIMSLSEVDDTATQILMTSFYDNLLQGLSKRSAFHKAQKHLQTISNGKYAHPRFWAVFVMID